MPNLRPFLIESLGASAVLSLRTAADRAGYSIPFSMGDLISSEPGFGAFTPLHIESTGSGSWRADRLRIYFFVQGGGVIPATTHFAEFVRLFPQIFMGKGDQMGGIEGLTPNIATTFYRQDKPVNGEPTLQFTLDARVLFQYLPAPDMHDDWVGFVHQDASSFSVQTLKRNFSDAKDAGFGYATAAAITAATFGLGGPVGAISGITVAWLNRYHFLSGRRSWRISKLQPFSVDIIPGAQVNVFFLETAAIDRFSTWVIDLATLTGDLGLGNVTVQTATVWSNLLRNYAAFGRNRFGYRLDISAWEQKITENVSVPFARRENGVFIDQGEFGTKTELLANPWVKEIIKYHPGIAAQF